MSRIRSIKPSFFSDEDLSDDLTITERLFYIGLWTLCYDNWTVEYRPRTFKRELFPFDDDVPITAIEAMVQTLVNTGRAVVFDHDGRACLYLPKCEKHQRVNRPTESLIPVPDEGSVSPHLPLSEDSPPEGKGREEEGKRKGTRDAEHPDEKIMRSSGRHPPCLDADIEVLNPDYTGSCWGFIVGQAEQQFGNLLSPSERAELADAIAEGCIPGCTGEHPVECAVHIYDKLKLKGKTRFATSRLWLKCIREDRMEAVR